LLKQASFIPFLFSGRHVRVIGEQVRWRGVGRLGRGGRRRWRGAARRYE